MTFSKASRLPNSRLITGGFQKEAFPSMMSGVVTQGSGPWPGWPDDAMLHGQRYRIAPGADAQGAEFCLGIDDYYVDYRTAPRRLPIGKNPFSQAHILKRGVSRINDGDT